MSTVGQRIEQILTLRGISARELARRADLGETTVRQIIIRGGPRTGPDTIAKIAKAGGVEQEWLATGNGPMELQTEPEERSVIARVIEAVEKPILSALPNWATLLRGARREVPEADEWVWTFLGASNGLLTGPLSVGALAKMARLVMEYESPPATASTVDRPKKGR